MDGTETKGSASVSIIAKYGRHNEFLFFRVWIPDFPLEIQLSDDKLSQIKGWKVPIDLSTARSVCVCYHDLLSIKNCVCVTQKLVN